MTPKIIAVDYDGTIDFSGYPNSGLSVNKELIEYLKEWRENGNELILWTCRDGNELQDAIDVCKGYGLEFDSVNKNTPRIEAMNLFHASKVLADVYLDDRGMTPTDRNIRFFFKGKI